MPDSRPRLLLQAPLYLLLYLLFWQACRTPMGLIVLVALF